MLISIDYTKSGQKMSAVRRVLMRDLVVSCCCCCFGVGLGSNSLASGFLALAEPELIYQTFVDFISRVLVSCS